MRTRETAARGERYLLQKCYCPQSTTVTSLKLGSIQRKFPCKSERDVVRPQCIWKDIGWSIPPPSFLATASEALHVRRLRSPPYEMIAVRKSWRTASKLLQPSPRQGCSRVTSGSMPVRSRIRTTPSTSTKIENLPTTNNNPTSRQQSVSAQHQMLSWPLGYVSR